MAVYDFLAWFLTQTCFYYCANPFKMFSIRNSMASWGSLYYCFHVGGVAVIVACLVFGPFVKRFHIESEKKKAQ